MFTSFSSVYNRFLGKITDDMYMELTPDDTIRDLRSLLIQAVPGFEFPRKSLDYIIVEDRPEGVEDDCSYFIAELSSEEINILAILMLEVWLQRQVTSIENIRMKYSGTDFKMTSQANHLGKLLALLTEVQRQSKHMQRLYKRRKTDSNGNISSNWSVFGQNPARVNRADGDESDFLTDIVLEGGII